MKDMTKGDPLGLILRFAFPLLLGNLLQQFYNLADAAIVGRFLGANALAAVGATGSVYASAHTVAARINMFAICPFDALCSGTTTFCSQNYGAGDYGRIREGVRISIFAAVLYGLTVGTLLVFFGRYACLIFLSADETKILDAAHMVLRRCGYAFAVLGLLDVSRASMQAFGYSGHAMVSGIMEMIARAGVVILFAPRFGFNAISLADPAAWIAADLYMIPIWILVMRRVKRMLVSRSLRKKPLP